MKTILLNDKPVQSEAQSVEQFIVEQKIERRFLAVMVDDTIIAKSDWERTQLKNNSRVDVYSPVGGG
ncbi:sulfur carrier protein ThiS [bacterium]|nr:sulfur carrier protein ThiS [bacterium]